MVNIPSPPVPIAGTTPPSREYYQFFVDLGKYKVADFTPSLAFTTPGNSTWVYTVQVGVYRKTAGWVDVQINLNATPTIGTGTGALKVVGFPFAPSNSAMLAVSNMDDDWVWPASATMAHASIDDGDTFASLIGVGPTINPTAFTEANMSTGTTHTLRIFGGYRTAT